MERSLVDSILGALQRKQDASKS